MIIAELVTMSLKGCGRDKEHAEEMTAGIVIIELKYCRHLITLREEEPLAFTLLRSLTLPSLSRSMMVPCGSVLSWL